MPKLAPPRSDLENRFSSRSIAQLGDARWPTISWWLLCDIPEQLATRSDRAIPVCSAPVKRVPGANAQRYLRTIRVVSRMTKRCDVERARERTLVAWLTGLRAYLMETKRWSASRDALGFGVVGWSGTNGSEIFGSGNVGGTVHCRRRAQGQCSASGGALSLGRGAERARPGAGTAARGDRPGVAARRHTSAACPKCA